MSENLKKKSNKRMLVIVSAVLALLLFCGGVGYALAQMSASLTIGGNISFSAQHVYATVSAGTVSGNSSSDSTTDKMTTLTYTADNTSDVDTTSWSNLALHFDDNASPITITFTITNNSTENELNITVGEMGGTYTNAGKVLKIGGEEKTKDAVVKLAKSGESGNSATVTITFSVTDKNKAATISNFTFGLTLANAVEASE